MIINTIGFTKISAEDFFHKISSSKTETLIDTRLNNTSQLAGFAKARDLKYFLEKICAVEYRHEPLLAPTEDILKRYQKKTISWADYESLYISLLEYRQVENKVQLDLFGDICLLCSEDKPHYCHRRLAAEYMKKKKYQDARIRHL